MLYYSLNRKSASVNFRQATIEGQAPDGGLYFPCEIPRLPRDFIDGIDSLSWQEIALQVIKPYIGDSLSVADLKEIILETISFEIPLVPITDRIYSLELFHGPTLAFKDIGARFMSRCLGHFSKDINKKITVLVATSGDTGGAVASGFYDIAGINVVILYPSGKVSTVQERQLTSFGKNITTLEIDGTFDDCQHLVKQAFADPDLNHALFLTSANSINVARWLPQQFYYFFAFQQWKQKDKPPVICVPSGNFGNVCAGLLAYRSGLPAAHFIAACNANQVVPDFLDNGIYAPRKALATLSNAMDVGNPSNFERVLELFDRQANSLKKVFSSRSVSDEQTKSAILEVFSRYQYLLDPHGAVGYCALQEYLSDHAQQKGILLETAHPVKFYDIVEPIISCKIPVPRLVQEIMGKSEKSIKMPVNFPGLKQFLLSQST